MPKNKMTRRQKNQPSEVRVYTFKKSIVWVVGVTVVIIILGLVALLLRQPIENNYYSHQAKTALISEVNRLGGTLENLGVNGNITTGCSPTVMSSDERTATSCSASMNSYKLIGTDKQAKELAIENGAKLDRALKTAGWTETRNAAPTFKDWFSQITAAKDWLPDEGAYKASSDASCILEVTLAYSNPHPPAYNANISCTSPKFPLPR